MAETGEIVAGATSIGAFLGGLFGAWKLLKPGTQPENGDGMAEVFQRIAKLEQRADECDLREAERHVWRDQVFARLLELDKKTSAILAILDERRHER